MFPLVAVSHATLLFGSSLKQASKTESETKSHSLSGCPRVTDSLLNKKVDSFYYFDSIF